jgi:hypothetical protein
MKIQICTGGRGSAARHSAWARDLKSSADSPASRRHSKLPLQATVGSTRVPSGLTKKMLLIGTVRDIAIGRARGAGFLRECARCTRNQSGARDRPGPQKAAPVSLIVVHLYDRLGD